VIVASLLLIAGATGLLVLGLWQSSSAMLSGSIAASLLAAVVLVVGTRRSSYVEDTEPVDELADEEREAEPALVGQASRAEAAREDGAEPVEAGGGAPTVTIPTQGSAAQEAAPLEEEAAEPADEPPMQQVSPADAARVSRMMTEVLVVDGRPRYHLSGCVHLLGRESEPLPVAEAVELGFTPCGLCEPDSALLADAGRV
jgi:hypothetical protein